MTSRSAEEASMIDEILNMFEEKALTRPGVKEVHAAVTLIKSIKKDEDSKLREIDCIQKKDGVSQELFSLFQELQRAIVRSENEHKKRDAEKVLEIDNAYKLFGKLVDDEFRGVSLDSLQKMRVAFGGDNSESSSSSSVKSEIKSSSVSSVDIFFDKLTNTMSTLGILYRVNGKKPWEGSTLSSFATQIAWMTFVATCLTALRMGFIFYLKKMWKWWLEKRASGGSSGGASGGSSGGASGGTGGWFKRNLSRTRATAAESQRDKAVFMC